MNQREAFLRAIRKAPYDDTHRLVYADWLTDHGEATHAQLIRVQCELADKKCQGTRRESLVAEESRLLEDPVLHLNPKRPFTYERGFVRNRCLLYTPRDDGFEVLVERAPTERSDTAGTEDTIVLLTAENVAVLDRFLALSLQVSFLNALGDAEDSPLFKTCLRRVTVLDGYDTTATGEPLTRLAASPHLIALDTVSLENCLAISLPGVLALFTAPEIPGIKELFLTSEGWQDDADTFIETDDAPEIADFVRRLGRAPRAARLAYFTLGYLYAGNRVAQALLDSPHLQPASHLELYQSPSMSGGQQRALKKRFGKALQLL
jgi:uncharacterized protein (TIGR02996 family)